MGSFFEIFLTHIILGRMHISKRILRGFLYDICIVKTVNQNLWLYSHVSKKEIGMAVIARIDPNTTSGNQPAPSVVS